MAAVPKSLLTLGASLLTARASIRLKRSEDAAGTQDRVFKSLIPKLSAATAWRDAGIERGIRYEAFRERIRPSTYEDLGRFIDRMKAGEPDVLWPGTCSIYSASSGTATGQPRTVPVTEEMLAHFKRSGMDSVLWYCARERSRPVFNGRHLFLGGSTALAPIPESEPFEAYAGGLGAITSLNLPGWVERSYYEPGAEIGQIADWQAKIAAITERTAGADISLLAGMAPWVLTLAYSLLEHSANGGRPAHLQEIWPRLDCYMHGGLPADPFEDELRSVLGPTVKFHEVYSSAEGFIAAQDADSASGLRLMADAGIFFEFIPMADFDETRVRSLGQKAVPISGVRTGIDYALVLTTPAGLTRYVVGDVVRFVSTKPPRITYVGRTNLRLNAFSEQVNEKEITDALIAICRRNGWTIVNFHVAPLFSRSTRGLVTGRHEWWVELKPGTSITPTGPIMAIELDTELRRLSREYDAKRNAGGFDAPFVRLVMPGVFEQWMRYHGKWGGHNKMPRCRSDRIIADELGGALQFAKD